MPSQTVGLDHAKELSLLVFVDIRNDSFRGDQFNSNLGQYLVIDFMPILVIHSKVFQPFKCTGMNQEVELGDSVGTFKTLLAYVHS